MGLDESPVWPIDGYFEYEYGVSHGANDFTISSSVD
jgi:hypothetical protein